MSDMEEVLRLHRPLVSETTYLTCNCDVTARSIVGHAAHVAQALINAGYGKPTQGRAQAFDEGYAAGRSWPQRKAGDAIRIGRINPYRPDFVDVSALRTYQEEP